MAKITVIGLGYVGLPLAVAFAEKGHTVFGVDTNPKRISELREGKDRTMEVAGDKLRSAKVTYTTDIKDGKGSDFFIITVPTPLNAEKVPDMSAVQKASESVGTAIGKGAIVVLESSVYPGTTEEIMGPAVGKTSGLKSGKDFKLAYSPERVNPGDKTNTVHTITKIVAGQDEETADKVEKLYKQIVEKTYHAKSIKVAEATKVIENTHRDVNIAYLNEMAVFLDRMDVSIWDVLDAAKTKWNFIPFAPGFVGGDCIPVNPYYLMHKAGKLGCKLKVVEGARSASEFMDSFVLGKILRALKKEGRGMKGAKALVLGVSFKENVPDARNSMAVKLAEKMKAEGADVSIVDPVANLDGALREIPQGKWDVVVFAVPHKEFEEEKVRNMECLVLFDVKAKLRNRQVKARNYLTF